MTLKVQGQIKYTQRVNYVVTAWSIIMTTHVFLLKGPGV